MSRNRLSDRDIERLLTGGEPEDSALTGLIPLFESLQVEWDRRPDPETVRSFATTAAVVAAAGATGLTTDAPNIPASPGRSHRLMPRLAVPLAFVILLSTFTSAAIAADGAVPGDRLYGLNLALEKVGIGRGGVEERLREASVLAARGQAQEALAHAAASLAGAELNDEDATETASGLESAIDRLTADVPGEANEVRGRIVEMLEWMTDNAGLIDDPESDGAFGKGVAAMAGQIGADRGGADSSEDSDAQDEGTRGLGGPPGTTPGPPIEGIPPNRP